MRTMSAMLTGSVAVLAVLSAPVPAISSGAQKGEEDSAPRGGDEPNR